MFTSNVKALMKGKKMTVQRMVEAAGCSSATIHRAQQDRGIETCRMSTLGWIADALNVSVHDLFDGEYEPPTGGKL